jgi:hypothetical protein
LKNENENCLTIKNLEKQDAGLYSVLLENEVGTISSNKAELIVESNYDKKFL